MKSLVVFSVVLTVINGVFPPEFKKCSLKNANFETCVVEAATNGVSKLTKAFPQYKIPKIDPLDLHELTIAPGSKDVVAVEQKFKNCKVFGLSKLKFSLFAFEFSKQQYSGEGIVPDLQLKCDYELNGKILVLPIVGAGASTIDLDNVEIKMILPWKETKRSDGQTMIKYSMKNFSLKPEKIRFHFENLFNGDKTLGDNINKVLNENWAQVWSDVREGYEKAIGLICVELTNDFYSTVSKEDAFN